MVLAVSPIGKPAPVEPEAPTIYAKTYRHSIVDSTYQPERSILSQVRGRARMGQYFRQFLQGEEEPKSFSPSNLGTYQSYTKIDNYPFKIDGDGSFSFDPETGEGTVVYSAYTIADRPPIIYDVIIFDIGDGNAGLFEITEQPEIRNFTANKVYAIQIKQKCILTEELFTILAGPDGESGRVVESFVYSKDSALHGGHSVITKGEMERGKEIFNWGLTISNYIMRTFWWNPEKTIVLEYKGAKLYDPYLVNFLCSVITPNQRTLYPEINQFSIQYGGLDNQRYGTINIWELFLRGDLNILPLCDNKAAVIETSRLTATRLYGNLRSSKIRYFLTTNPEDFKTYARFYDGDGNIITKPGPEVETHYLFSEGFYKGKPEGEFENLVTRIFINKEVDPDGLLDYCKKYFELTEKERLYHGAILLRLIMLARPIGGPL